MSHELEAAAADAGSGLFRRLRKGRHTRPPGSPCANCGVVLLGPWCHACGQFGEDLHRSTPHLLAEAVEGLFHFDSRVWRTLPRLFIKPGELTRSYLAGRRASQVAPLRLFLVVLLLVFFAGSLGSAGPKRNEAHPAERGAGARGAGAPGPQSVRFDLGPRRGVPVGAPRVQFNFGSKGSSKGAGWLGQKVERAAAHPEEFKLILESWGERFAFMALPIASCLLAALFIFQRRFYFYDHVIFSMHSLSFQGLLVSIYFLCSWMGDWADVLLLAAPIHLFAHMRGVYETSVLGTLARMAVLAVLSLAAVVFLFLGLVLVGLSSMTA